MIAGLMLTLILAAGPVPKDDPNDPQVVFDLPQGECRCAKYECPQDGPCRCVANECPTTPPKKKERK